MVKVNEKLQVVLAFIVGIIILFSIYALIILLVTESPEHLIQQAQEYWYWLVPMGIGFGTQTSMFWYIKSDLHLTNHSAGLAGGTSLASSTASMVACCAHHLLELLPFLGLSALSFWLAEYQGWLFFVGIVFNLIGILVMYRIIKKNIKY